jgi:threonine synthase
MAQAVYYVTASLALGGPWRKLSFAVPTGNFGDVYAGYVAAKMGLPVDQLIVATNRNDILARFFQDGVYQAGEVHPTISPSMDIQVASNFERLLFDLYDRNPDALTAAMAGFAETGELAAGDNLLGRAREKLDAGRADEAATRAEMRRTLDETGLLIDPHSAVARHVGRVSRLDPAVPLVTLATAHPAKFPDAVEQATGVRPALPPHMADLMTREERFATLPNDVAALKDHIDKLPLETA